MLVPSDAKGSAFSKAREHVFKRVLYRVDGGNLVDTCSNAHNGSRHPVDLVDIGCWQVECKDSRRGAVARMLEL